MRLAAAALALLAGVGARAEAAPASRPEVRLDARVELCAALHLLAARAGRTAEPGFRDDGGAYARELLAATVELSTHPAVAAYVRALRRPTAAAGFRFMTALHEARRCLDDGLRLRADREDCRGSSFAHAAEDFAARARFRELLPRLEAAERAPLDALERSRSREDLVSLYERYARLSAGAQRVAPSPLLESGRVWNDLDREADGRYQILTAISPSSATRAFDWTPLLRDVGHEHSHALLDAAVDAADGAAGPAPSGEGADCYGSWSQCLREHVAQGVSLRLVQRAAETGDPAPAPEPAANARLPWHAEAAAALRDYEADPRRYPTLRDFVPVLVSRLRALAAARPGAAAARAPAARERENAPARRAMERGVELFSAGRSTEAAEAFSAAAAAGGGASAEMSLAAARRAQGRPDEAAAALDRAVADARSDDSLGPTALPDALSSRADLRALRGDAAGAAADLEEALETAALDWPRRAETERALAALRAPRR